MPAQRTAKRPTLTMLVVATLVALSLGACTSSSVPVAPASQPGTSKGDEPDPLKELLRPLLSPFEERLSAKDGLIPENRTLTASDMDVPAVANLDPELRKALQEASKAAAADGIQIVVTSGWRSTRYQKMLLDQATGTYGSPEEARRWVNTPEKSTHVSGKAVDVGPVDAMVWMSNLGQQFGLCQTYANEPWHYELTAQPGAVCPPALTDAANN
ncbi:M15 family metallopeptidase [Paenarthrobacter sp. NPDC056912]|uniref:M15 family metallopeptidase n=1 Tax=Paenarthrobacter sp. NPDC056912 TaxID=3345965 RepID=UPI00366B9D63